MDLFFWQQNYLMFIPVLIWDLIWRGIALWFASRRNQKYWFIVLLIINSIGILPIIYLVIYRKRKNS